MLFQADLKFQGKRNHIDSVKQDIGIQSKKQKLDFEECNERDNTDGRSTNTDTPQTLNEKLVNSEIQTESVESDNRRNSEEKNSRSNVNEVTESKEIPVLNKQEVLGSLRNCDVVSDITTHSSVIGSSQINEKQDMDEPSQVMEVDTLSVETSTISNRTFNKRLFLLELRLFRYCKSCLNIVRYFSGTFMFQNQSSEITSIYVFNI